MFERFTERSRRVMVLAQEEARILDHDFIGTEHLLLGLLAEGQGVAAIALSGLGITLEDARAAVLARIGPTRSTTTGDRPFTPRAKKVLELSLREGLHLGHNYIGTEHMLLGLVREGEGVAMAVLSRLGADGPTIRKRVLVLLAGGGTGGADRPGSPKAWKAIDAKAVEPADIPVAAMALLGWDDVTDLFRDSLRLADAHIEHPVIDGIEYEACTYRIGLPPEITLAVVGAAVTREAFDAYTSGSLPKAEIIGGLGDAATYSAAGGSLRVLAGSILFVVTVRRHAGARALSIATARRVLENLSAQQS